MQNLIPGLLFLAFMITIRNVHADSGTSDFCIICTPETINATCHNKDTPSEKFSCSHLQEKQKVNLQHYICEKENTEPFRVNAISCSMDTTTPSVDWTSVNTVIQPEEKENAKRHHYTLIGGTIFPILVVIGGVVGWRSSIGSTT